MFKSSRRVNQVPKFGARTAPDTWRRISVSTARSHDLIGALFLRPRHRVRPLYCATDAVPITA